MPNDVMTLLPFIFLAVWGMLILLADLWIPKGLKWITPLLTALGLLVTLGINLSQGGRVQTAFNNMVVMDNFTVFMNTIFLASALGGVALAYDYLKRMDMERGEYYVLLLFSTCGMLLMSSAYDLIMVFLALELLSIPLYVLAGFARPRPDSEESALKYFLLGAFASGFTLYGIALVFGATAHTGLADIFASLKGNSPVNLPLLLPGAGLLLVGLGFKVAAAPFHRWTPDVYQGAPSPVSGFMSIAVKAAGFAALLRVLVLALPSLSVDITPVLWGLAALTMLVGNVIALAQTNIKRLLAYSSIAHAGYLLMALVPYGNQVVSKDTVASLLFYLIGYGLSTLGAWAVVIALEQAEGRGLNLEDYAGLGRKHPLLAFSMLIFMLSFAGIPLTLGFWGKFYLFRTAVLGGFYWLALIGLLTSVLSAYYYLRVVMMMFMREGDPQISQDRWVKVVAVVSAVLVVGLSFWPNSLLQMAAQAILQLN
jgi:NADH-quinone oxidoreductase subunit N